MGIQLNKTYIVQNKSVIIELSGERLYRVSVGGVCDYVSRQKIKKMGLISAVDNYYIKGLLLELKSRLEDGTYKHCIAEEKAPHEHDIQKLRKKPDFQNNEYSDYSNSYVSGDMGRPNTTYWNGYR